MLNWSQVEDNEYVKRTRVRLRLEEGNTKLTVWRSDIYFGFVWRDRYKEGHAKIKRTRGSPCAQ
jgi:hypothetical protein